MLEMFSFQKTKSEISRQALLLRYDGSDNPTLLSRAHKANNQVKVGENARFKLLRDAMHSDQVFYQFVLFTRSKDYAGIKKKSLEYLENIKMMYSTAVSIFEQTKKFDKDSKAAMIDEIFVQVENFHLMMMKQPGELQGR